MKRILVASLACRVNSTRLYAKPLQPLDIERGISVLDYVLDFFKTVPVVDHIVPAISADPGNAPFRLAAERHSLPWVMGSEDDVLKRHLDASSAVGATDALIITPESPFLYFEAIDDAWSRHLSHGNDVTGVDALPDGSGFSINRVAALQRSYDEGEERHRGETSLYIRENPDEFKVERVDVPVEVRRPDIRLTVDYPEDLVLCRRVYDHFRDQAPRIPVGEIIRYLEDNPQLLALVEPYVENPELYDD